MTSPSTARRGCSSTSRSSASGRPPPDGRSWSRTGSAARYSPILTFKPSSAEKPIMVHTSQATGTMDGTTSTRDHYFEAVLRNLSDGVYFCDRERRITYWSPGAERITGFSAAEVQGSSCADGILTHVDEAGTSLCEAHCPLSATMEDGEPRETQVYLHHKEGHRVPVLVRTSPIYNDAGEIDSVVEVFSDNSRLLDALAKVERLSVEAETDPLTGVGNRRSIETRLDAYVAERRKRGRTAGVLFVDIDHFKNVNDTFGHDVGDRVLKMVAQTIKHNLRSSDWLARWGGEEFLILLDQVDRRSLPRLAEKLRMLVANSYLTRDGGPDLRVTVSIGATLLRRGDTRDKVVARADSLMYESKEAGRDRLTWSA